MEATEAAWLAGLLEGEGTFRLEKHSGRNPRPTIEIKMTDRDVIERAASLMGVRKIQKRPPASPRHQRQYRARIQGKRAQQIMSEVLPYLGRRRSEKVRSLL